MLVPGDIVSIKLGDIIPADARLLEGDPLKIDQVICFQYSIFILFVNLLLCLIYFSAGQVKKVPCNYNMCFLFLLKIISTKM